MLITHIGETDEARKPGSQFCSNMAFVGQNEN